MFRVLDFTVPGLGAIRGLYKVIDVKVYTHVGTYKVQSSRKLLRLAS